jgi:hypothetical protein
MNMKIKSIRIPDELEEKLKAKAGQGNIKLSKVLRENIDFYLGLDATLLKSARRIATALNITPAQVISNLALSRLAELEAKRGVYGPTYELLHEFLKYDHDVIEGEKCISLLKKAEEMRDET